MPKVVQNWVIKKAYTAYHKNHINKVIMTAFTTYAFMDSTENGGEVVKLGML